MFAKKVWWRRSISKKRKVKFPSCIALMIYHKRCKLVDEEAISRLKSQTKEPKANAPDSAILLACQLFCKIGMAEKARILIAELLQRNQALRTARVYSIDSARTRKKSWRN